MLLFANPQITCKCKNPECWWTDKVKMIWQQFFWTQAPRFTFTDLETQQNIRGSSYTLFNKKRWCHIMPQRNSIKTHARFPEQGTYTEMPTSTQKVKVPSNHMPKTQ